MLEDTRHLAWSVVLSIAATFAAGCGGGGGGGGTSGTLLADDFESYPVGSDLMGPVWSDLVYELDEGQWTVVADPDHPERGQVARLTGHWSSAIAGDSTWTDYRIGAQVRPTGSYDGIIGRLVDGSHCYVLVFAGGKLKLQRQVGGASLAQQDMAVDAGTYYELAMELEGDTVRGFVDGVLVLTYVDPSPLTQGKAGVVGAEGMFDDVVVTRL